MTHVSEARRAVSRIGANYVRLGLSVVLGLLVVPMLLGRLGAEVYGLIGLLGSTIGLAALVQEVVRESMVRELGDAYHDSDERFAATFNAAQLICLGAAAVSLAMFAIVWLIVPLLRIPPDLLGAARWLVAAKGLETSFAVALAPQQRMYLVTERMVLANLWQLAERMSQFIGAVVIVLIATQMARPGALVLYAWISASCVILAALSAAAMMIALDRRVAPRPRRATREAARGVLSVGGWNFMTLLAANLHIRLDQVLMNLFLGLSFNAVFSVAVTLGSYARMTTLGVTSGVEAVAARLSSRAPGGAVAVLLRHSTRLHALVALPAAAGILTLAEPILHVWLGNRLEESYMAMAATLTRLVLIGVTARAISDGWFKVLYGAGHIRRYAPLVLIGGLANPLVAIGLLLTLPGPLRYMGPAISYAGIIVALHFLIAPRVVGRALGLRYRDVLAPVGRPLAATLLVAPVLIISRYVIAWWTPLALAMVIIAFCALYAGAVWLLVVEPQERRRIRAATLGRLGLAH